MSPNKRSDSEAATQSAENAGTVESVSTAPAPTTTAAPGNAPTQSTRTTVFDGAYIQNGVRRQVSVIDPITSKSVSQSVKRDIVSKLVCNRVSGFGNFPNTGEPYVTLSGQYAPGKTLRITMSSQNRDAVAALLKGKIANKETKELTEELVFTAVGEPMRGFGMLVSELALHRKDGSTEIIIGPAGEQTASESAEQAFL